MKNKIKTLFAIAAFTFITNTISAQSHKMDSDGRTISNSSGSTVGK